MSDREQVLREALVRTWAEFHGLHTSLPYAMQDRHKCQHPICSASREALAQPSPPAQVPAVEEAKRFNDEMYGSFDVVDVARRWLLDYAKTSENRELTGAIRLVCGKE